MTNKKTNKLPLIAFASLPLTVGLVFAQAGTGTTAQQPQRVQPTQPGGQSTSGSTTPQGQQNQQRPQPSGTNYADVFLQKLAAQLGVSLDKLKSAATAAGNATIDQGVKAGDFPNDMATNMKQRLQTDPFALAGGRGGPGGGHGHGMDDSMNGPRGMAGQAVLAAVAKTLGLDAQGLFGQLQGGKTVADLAKAKGVSTAAVHSAAVSALKTELAADVKAGRLTQAQADQMLQNAQGDANFGLKFGGRGMRGHLNDLNSTPGTQGSAQSSTSSGI